MTASYEQLLFLFRKSGTIERVDKEANSKTEMFLWRTIRFWSTGVCQLFDFIRRHNDRSDEQEETRIALGCTRVVTAPEDPNFPVISAIRQCLFTFTILPICQASGVTLPKPSRLNVHARYLGKVDLAMLLEMLQPQTTSKSIESCWNQDQVRSTPQA